VRLRCGLMSNYFDHLSSFLDRIARTTDVHAIYCYRPSSVVCRSVCHTNEPPKTAEPIEIQFGLRTRVGPGNNVLDGGPDPPWEGVILRGGGASHCIKYRYRDILRSSMQRWLNRSRYRLGQGFWEDSGWPREACIGGSRYSHQK